MLKNYRGLHAEKRRLEAGVDELQLTRQRLTKVIYALVYLRQARRPKPGEENGFCVWRAERILLGSFFFFCLCACRNLSPFELPSVVCVVPRVVSKVDQISVCAWYVFCFCYRLFLAFGLLLVLFLSPRLGSSWF